jgi:hypothetical protein
VRLEWPDGLVRPPSLTMAAMRRWCSQGVDSEKAEGSRSNPRASPRMGRHSS